MRTRSVREIMQKKIAIGDNQNSRQYQDKTRQEERKRDKEDETRPGKANQQKREKPMFF